MPLSTRFDYLPASNADLPDVGSRVTVPFGRRQQTGLVLGRKSGSELPADKLRRASAALDDEPLLSASDLWMISFCSQYYHHPIGEVVAAALPALLRQGKPLYPQVEMLSASDLAPEGLDSLGRAPKQAELLQLLLDAGEDGLSADTLVELLPNWRRSLKPLLEKGLVHRREVAGSSHTPVSELTAEPGPELNEAQATAVDSVRNSKGFDSFLLDGVTGSGKTEVYLHLISDVIRQGKQALVLVPEIGLTPQLVNRFRKRLGVEPALLHSGLSDVERLNNWRRARDGEASLVLGTRSAVFVPLPKPGLVIVDEEHDPSLKQQEGLRYSARDLAVARAKHADIPVMLGSATPSLELLAHCRSGLYQHLRLPERAGGASPPVIRLVDTTRAAGSDGLSQHLLDRVAAHLDMDGQVLMFLNRRGFAPTLICSDCGHVAECRRCDARMTVHARQDQLRCHHCGAARPIDNSCDDCGADMRPLGEGTQKLEDLLNARFPDYEVKRIDSDSMQRKGSIGEALEAATGGDAQILVGTQMLSKGHHFPKLTLVGIINADQGLFGTDFRSAERLAQSIVQVAGRAGREQHEGEVLIQTAFREHPFWQQLLEGGYEQIADNSLKEREKAHWPPYTRLALIRSSAHRQSDAMHFLQRARQRLLQLADGRLQVLGPVEAPLSKRAGRYRVQLLLEGSDRQALHHCLATLRPELEGTAEARKVRWSVDVDPIELL